MMARQQNSDPQQVLSFVRFGFLGSVLFFGIFAWVFAWGMGDERGMAPELTQGIEFYVWAGFALLFLGAVGGISLVRMQWEATSDVETKQTYNIVGWALAEIPGLLGAVYLMLEGDPTFFALGVVLLGGAVFFWLPVPDDQRV